MSSSRRFAALLLLFVSSLAHAGEVYLGTITSAGATATNGFVIPGRAKLSIQCDAAAYIRNGTPSTTDVASTNGVKVSADQLLLWSSAPVAVSDAGTTTAVIHVISSSGTVNCKVFSRVGDEG